jgi:transglutaminase-like putative cysteine protease
MLLFCAGVWVSVPRAWAGDAPRWMHSLVNAPLPTHDDKTDAVLLYSEYILTIQPNGKIKGLERGAYKILRVGGKKYGLVLADFDADTRVTAMHGWCIPAQGKDYEVKEKDAIEAALGVENGELVTDVRSKILQIPAADIGNIVGYEVEQELRPYVLQDDWVFQRPIPTAEARYTLQLPAGWEYKVAWVNHAEVAPAATGNNQWQWVIKDIPAVKAENQMPPWRGLAEKMVVSIVPAGGAGNRGFQNWNDMGNWQDGLARGRRDVSPEIKQKVAVLTASATSPLEKIRAVAGFTQREIRYVAIELGIGGYQPHAAKDIFTHRYGDCKDKATLVSAMLAELGVQSYYVIINSERGAVTATMPPQIGIFDHAILAIKLPEGVSDPSLVAFVEHPKLGKLLIFDPTDEMTPFGQLRGALQANYGLFVTPAGGDLLELPQLPSTLNTTERLAKLKLDDKGTLTGDIREVRHGDPAVHQRYALQSASQQSDKIKPIETMLAQSLGSFHITNAVVGNLAPSNLPFEYRYSVVSENYAKPAGNLLLVRPRVVGYLSRDLLETKEARKFPIEFEGPWRNSDTFEIALPAGYEVEDLPPPVNAEYSFAEYHSKSEVSGNTLKYTRTFEIKELSVPVSKAEELKKFYRIIGNDERNTAVLKPSAK